MFTPLLVLLLVTQRTTTQDSTSNNCKGNTIIQYFGTDGNVELQTLQPDSLTGRGPSGPPGKRGPIGSSGSRGQKGEFGSKGQKGEPALDSGVEELRRIVDQMQNSATPTSCEEAAAETSRYSLISPLGSQGIPFYAYCEVGEMSEGLQIVRRTTIGHDSEAEIPVDNCENARCYKRKVRYSVPMRQIVQLIEASRHCRQFIKYRCQGSLLFRDRNTHAAWVSRNGTLKRNWGGSERERYCACGETDTCIDNRHHCNCDQNSVGIVTSDEGYLTNKADLPVTEMQFGDASDKGEFGWHTLGKLECW